MRGGPVKRGREASPAVELARIAAARIPLARRDRERDGAACRPSASSSSQPRSRGHSRSSASCATSTVPSSIVTRRLAGEHVEHAAHVRVAVGLELLERDPPAHRAAARVLAGEAQQDAARDDALRRVEARVRHLGEARDRAAHAAACARSRPATGGGPRAAATARAARSRAAAAPRAPARRRRAAGRRAQARRAGRRAAPAARSRGAARRAASGRRGRGWRASSRASSGYAAQRP